MRAKAP
jgi:hypothetical protein